MKSLRKLGFLAIFMALAMLSIQCGKGAEKQGRELSLLKMLPENASGFATINFKKVSELGLFKTMQDSMKNEDGEQAAEALSTFSDFLGKTGFDPEKDLHGGALAILGGLDESTPQFVFLAQGTFDPEKIIAYAKAKTPDMKEETANGITLYQTEGKENAVICFPKPGLVAMGQPEALKTTIDVIQGKGRSLMDNASLSKFAQKIDNNALATAAFLFPEKAKNMQEQLPPPFEFDLSKAEAITADLFFQSDIWSGALTLVSANPEGNKKNANTLNMLKNMGVMMGPEVGDVLNGLTINANDQHLEIKFSITKAQLEKLGQKAKESLPAMSSDMPTEPITE